MLKEFFDSLKATVNEAHKPTVFEVPGIHDSVFIASKTGVVTHVKQPDDRRHLVRRVEDLAAWTTPQSVTWVDDNKIVVVIDDEFSIEVTEAEAPEGVADVAADLLEPLPPGLRRHTVTLELKQHPKFVALLDIGIKPLEHRDFVRFLRLHMKEEIEKAAPGWLTQVRNFKLQKLEQTHSAANHGGDSFGVSIAAEAAGIAALTEELRFAVPLWVGIDVDCEITCEFIVDTLASPPTFTLKARENDVADALKMGRDWLTQQVEGVVQGKVCQGRP